MIEDSIKKIKGVGPKTQKILNSIGISTIEDMLYFFPRDYKDKSSIKKLSDLEYDKKQAFIAKVLDEISERTYYKGGRTYRIIKAAVTDGTTTAYCVWFNQPYIKRVLIPGKWYRFYGKAVYNRGSIEINSPEYEAVGNDVGMQGSIEPVYPTTGGLTSSKIAAIIKEILDRHHGDIQDFMPPEVLKRHHLPDLAFALRQIHLPSDRRSWEAAFRRLVFDELFILQLGLSLIKGSCGRPGSGIAFKLDRDFLAGVLKKLPFELTDGQKKVMKEIWADMKTDIPMNRLIQGDVGSGKTVVAVLCLLIAVNNGYQGAMMAPTEILARQHYETVTRITDGMGINTGLLTGNLTAAQREELLDKLARGEIDILVGTHAIIQDRVRFYRLGMIITDEQHRFGVRQRAVFAGKGQNPDVLVMSATPIPRTLAFILHGDLDISTIHQLPPGRKEIKTYVIDMNDYDRLVSFMKREITQGRQVYIVCPLIETSSQVDALSVSDVYDMLTKDPFFSGITAVLHGRLSNNEKQDIMDRFKDNKLKVLISTTVIEVGVNVPNASLMVVFNAERFGLAQLHQLRGRIGRGSHASSCILVSDAASGEAGSRLKVLERYSDGFKISEMDLKLRGPGDFLGTRQHGLPGLRIANLARDMEYIPVIRREVEMLIKDKKKYDDNKLQLMIKQVRKMFGQDFQYISIN
ncbi:MAG: ATP-dependent DNA helicase RecG [Mahellales bacterium]|jgi:ATP-dependent DNA helicase RecG